MKPTHHSHSHRQKLRTRRTPGTTHQERLEAHRASQASPQETVRVVVPSLGGGGWGQRQGMIRVNPWALSRHVKDAIKRQAQELLHQGQRQGEESDLPPEVREAIREMEKRAPAELTYDENGQPALVVPDQGKGG